MENSTPEIRQYLQNLTENQSTILGVIAYNSAENMAMANTIVELLKVLLIKSGVPQEEVEQMTLALYENHKKHAQQSVQQLIETVLDVPLNSSTEK
jgi:type IV pilus biogenesis protein CpaD/CtpE